MLFGVYRCCVTFLVWDGEHRFIPDGAPTACLGFLSWSSAVSKAGLSLESPAQREQAHKAASLELLAQLSGDFSNVSCSLAIAR